MKNKGFLDILKEFGLGEAESKVYLAALSLGPSTVLKLAQSAEIKRTTTYDVIEALIQKGLMSLEVQGFKKKYVAEDPQKLSLILEQRRKNLESILPEFASLYNLKGGEGFIKYYQGLEGIKGVYESLISDILPGEDYLVFGNQEEWLNLDKEYFEKFADRRAKLPIKIRILFQDNDAGRYYQNIEKNINAEVRLLPPNTKLKTNLVMTPQKVFIQQLTPPVFGIVIQHRSIIEMH